MYNRIPLPTDNIYKFYALFGLLIVIFSLGSFLYVNSVSNNLIYEYAEEFSKLKSLPREALSLKEEVRLSLIEKKLNISESDKKILPHLYLCNIFDWLYNVTFRLLFLAQNYSTHTR